MHVEVRPLEWVETETGWRADAGFELTYEVFEHDRCYCRLAAGMESIWSSDEDSPDAAKAACRADHHARVLALLVPAEETKHV